jgi:hypothetical protein
MSVSAETYIVISLMFAVFAAVAAIGTSVVLGAGFERLRAGFEIIKNQSGFFADAIYKLDLKTQALDQQTAQLKAGLQDNTERVVRVEKQTQFIGDEMNELQQRILSGSPAQMANAPTDAKKFDGLLQQPSRPVVETYVERSKTPAHDVEISASVSALDVAMSQPDEDMEPEELPLISSTGEPPSSSDGMTTLLSRYFLGEGSGGGKEVVYH